MARNLSMVLGLLAGGLSLRGGELTLAIDPRWRGVELAVPSASVRNDAGQALRFTRLAALISELVLWREDGSSVRLDGEQAYFDAASGRRSATWHAVPEGAYVGLEFRIGLPPALNHADAGLWPAGHALNPLVNGLHWSWQGGYVFAALEGRWNDVDAVRAGERGFSYHLATDAREMHARFRANFDITGGTTVRLAWDLARTIGAIVLRAEDGSETTHSAPGDPLPERIATSAERSWFWLEAVNGATLAEREPTPAAKATGKGVAGVTPYAFVVPAGFPQPALPADNPLTTEGIALGRKLFFDPRLSANGRQSCASCHDPARAFSDDVALSRGVAGAEGLRNAMPLFNLALSPHYAWDGSQSRVRDQARAAWSSAIEMNADPVATVGALAKDSELMQLTAAAFGSPALSVDRALLALEQYLLTIVAADSRFDRAMRGAGELTAEEQHGFALFMTEYDPVRGRRGADCFHCHGGALFTDFALRNNGLARDSADPGREQVTGRASDRGAFKTPSLRNVALTGPYLHDGSVATLEEVVARYDHGVQRSATLDPNLAKHPDRGLELTGPEQQALVAFLRALTEISALPAIPSNPDPASQ